MREAQYFLTAIETAEFLRVPVSWVYDRSRKGTMPIQRVGKYLRIPRAVLVAWVAAGCPADWEAYGFGTGDA